MEISTKAIHCGSTPDKETGAVIPPIFMSSTFKQSYPAEHSGYEYTRAGNPNFTHLEQALAALENGTHATVFASGLSALTALVTDFKPGDFCAAIDGVYGGTYRLFTQVFSSFNIGFKTASDMESLEKLLAKKPKMLIIETPTNPLLEVFDIGHCSELCQKHGVILVVDNTFATPYNQNPLDLGADIVWHSTTKYIGGHSDIIGGALIGRDKKMKERWDFNRMSIGLNPSPFDTWLTLRGLKTLALRMERHGKNAQSLAEYLVTHPKVKKVYYPGLSTHPSHAIAKKQMHSFGGIVSVEFNLTEDETKQMISSFKYFILAESLGGIESLVNHPASMTHASIPQEERLRYGLKDGLVRFSCGIEDIKDLIQDLSFSA